MVWKIYNYNFYQCEKSGFKKLLIPIPPLLEGGKNPHRAKLEGIGQVEQAIRKTDSIALLEAAIISRLILAV